MSAPPADRPTRSDWFTESVDWAVGRISTTGPLSAAAADLLRGTVELLRRAGHARITVELHAPDEDGRAALRAPADHLRARHCELVVRCEEEKEKSW